MRCNQATQKAATFWNYFINDNTRKIYKRVTDGHMSGGIFAIGIEADDGSMGAIRWEKDFGWRGVGGDREWRNTRFTPSK